MKLKDFDYLLPKNLIAQKPVKPRDRSRLLLLSKKTGEIKHDHFYNIVDCFRPGDVLVLNNSKVMPARLFGRKKDTGGKIEVFLLKKNSSAIWQCLIGGRGARVGLEIEFKKKMEAKIIKNNQNGTWELKFNKNKKEFVKIVNKIGLMPLPPYIKRDKKQKSDDMNYQTVYASEKKTGSVAAPTAGFHFTPALLKKLEKKGVHIEYVTLHVGLGTFAPVKVNNIKKHKMHAEWAEVDKKTIARIFLAKSEGRRVIAVGTTSARALETIFSHIASRKSHIANKLQTSNSLCDMRYAIRDYSGWTDIFIYPGYKFKIVDGLITNFHLPKSTLLMLVCALAGKKNIDKAYSEAIKRKYRFYSYGDAMFIYDSPRRPEI
ncbi:MAG: tRNA preQ1(34) S-adenosylmethionine ribosyltransferase-isomerase QueA [Patescibacteria group bacterium]|nr:tRNA preQ1(34) S-adenosylmethionine ribosyltransferase-isomerase QueA [Patescibacteria group bacterium]